MDLAPEDLHLSKHTLCGDKEIGTVQQYREEESVGKAMSEVRSQACARRGETFNGSESRL